MTSLTIVCAVALLLIIIICYIISTYNKLVDERLKVNNQWSQINIVLKQRSDTIPNLVNTVSGYAAHEKELLENITSARNSYVTARTAEEAMKASGKLSKEVRHLFAVAENYPELKANTNFTDLQDKLAALENKIADFRQFYNDTVMRYNRLIVKFPSNLIANAFHFKERSFFAVDEEDKVIPEVKF